MDPAEQESETFQIILCTYPGASSTPSCPLSY
jgi:hypothetical protein